MSRFITRIINKQDRKRLLRWIGRYIDQGGVLDIDGLLHEQTILDRYARMAFIAERDGGSIAVEYYTDASVRPLSEYKAGVTAPVAAPAPADAPVVPSANRPQAPAAANPPVTVEQAPPTPPINKTAAELPQMPQGVQEWFKNKANNPAEATHLGAARAKAPVLNVTSNMTEALRHPDQRQAAPANNPAVITPMVQVPEARSVQPTTMVGMAPKEAPAAVALGSAPTEAREPMPRQGVGNQLLREKATRGRGRGAAGGKAGAEPGT